MFLDRQKCHAHAVSTRTGKCKAQLVTLSYEKLMWNLQQYARAVARLWIASASPTMRQVEQHLNSLGYDFVALFAPHVRYKSNAASIVLLRRMV